jgi:trk system potassium uptake protein TrkA
MVLRQLGVADFAHAIVGIGTDLAASLMTIMALTELGIQDIWVKALTAEHGHLAQRIGAHHVVYPEADMGERVAHLITGRMIDFIEFDDGFAIAKIHAPLPTQNNTLADANIREKYGVTVVGLKRANEDFQHATPSTLILPGDLLIVSGSTHLIQKFAGRSK